MMHLVSKFFTAVRVYGPKRAAASTMQYIGNWWFDFCNQTDTAAWIELHELEISSQSVAAGSPYVPCKSGPLRKVLCSIGFPANSVFLDFGCGKGKALLIASEFQFERVVGVEFSEELCKIARENARRYSQKSRCLGKPNVIHTDAAAYEFQGDENVVFLYDPFGTEILERVFENLRLSLVRQPRRLWVIYRAPEHRSVLDGLGYLALQEQRIVGGAEYLIYHHGP